MAIPLRRCGEFLVQAMPFIPVSALITEGAHENVTVIHCVADGNVTVNDRKGTSKVLTMEKGDPARVIPPGCLVTINAGTFDLA